MSTILSTAAAGSERCERSAMQQQRKPRQVNETEGRNRVFMNERAPASLLFILTPWHLLQVPAASRLFSMSTHLTSPNPPNSEDLGQWKEGILPCCAPSQPPGALLWTGPLLYPSSAFLPPFIPPLSPWPYRPHLTLRHPSTPLLGR